MKLLSLIFLSVASFSVNAGIIESISPPRDILENGKVSYKQVKVTCISSSEPRFIRKTGDLKQWCVSHSASSCFTKKLTAATKACKLRLDASQEVNVAKASGTVPETPASGKAKPVANTEKITEVPAKNDKLALELRKLEIDQQKLNLRRQQLDLRKHELELKRLNGSTSSSGSE